MSHLGLPCVPSTRFPDFVSALRDDKAQLTAIDMDAACTQYTLADAITPIRPLGRGSNCSALLGGATTVFLTATRLHMSAQGWLRQRPTLGNSPNKISYAERVKHNRRTCVTLSA